MDLNKVLVVKSFDVLKPIANEFVNYFYQYLFTKYPSAKAFFSDTKMEVQKKQLLNSLVYIVDHLNEPEELTQYLNKMGSRHVKYNVKAEHYDLVGDSLINTLKYFFKDQWSKELENAWLWAFGFISQAMIQGAAQSQVSNMADHIISEISNTIPQKDRPAFENDQVLSPLEKMSHDLARKMLYQALSEEVNDEFIASVREKARHLLEKAMFEEADAILKKPRHIKSA